jgi:hypothetical protein
MGSNRTITLSQHLVLAPLEYISPSNVPQKLETLPKRAGLLTVEDLERLIANAEAVEGGGEKVHDAIKVLSEIGITEKIERLETTTSEDLESTAQLSRSS